MEKQKKILAIECALLEAENPPNDNKIGYYDIFLNSLKEQGFDIVESKEIEELKLMLHSNLPEDCQYGHSEVKYCSIRNGEGNECKRCSSLQ